MKALLLTAIAFLVLAGCTAAVPTAQPAEIPVPAKAQAIEIDTRRVESLPTGQPEIAAPPVMPPSGPPNSTPAPDVIPPAPATPLPVPMEASEPPGDNVGLAFPPYTPLRGIIQEEANLELVSEEGEKYRLKPGCDNVEKALRENSGREVGLLVEGEITPDAETVTVLSVNPGGRAIPTCADESGGPAAPPAPPPPGHETLPPPPPGTRPAEVGPSSVLDDTTNLKDNIAIPTMSSKRPL